MTEDSEVTELERFFQDLNVGDGVLKPGMAGKACANIRTALRLLDYDIEFGDEYDDALANAVLRFQQDNKHRHRDGFVGRGTRRLLTERLLAKCGKPAFQRLEEPSDQYVYISYSRRDSKIVDQLASDIRKAGIRVWLDVEEIPPGENWQHAIQKGLMAASVLLFVSSEHSIQSAWTAHELMAFLQGGKTIIPVIVDDAGAHRLPLALQSVQWVDLRGGYPAALQQVLSALTGRVARGTPVVRSEKLSKGYVFISYAEEDSDFVSQLKEFLREHGYAYWDYDESDRDYHSQFFLELEGVIKEAVATLSVLSEAWKRSPWTVREYFFSEDVSVPVFLLRAKPIGPTLAIAGMHCIDFVANVATGFEKLKKALKKKKL